MLFLEVWGDGLFDSVFQKESSLAWALSFRHALRIFLFGILQLNKPYLHPKKVSTNKLITG